MKKIIALILVLVMALGLVACGPAGTTEKTEATEFVAEEYNGELPLVKEGEDNVITIGITTNPNVTDYNNNAYTLWLEEQTGVDIQFVQFAGSSKDTGTQISLMIAGGEELPDIIFKFGGVNKATGEEYGLDGYFVDTTDYFEHYGYYQKQQFQTIFGEEWEEPYNTLMSRAIVPSTGRMYCFPTFEDVPLDTPKFHPWINQQWLDKLGLTAPTTIDELYDVLVAFRDGDPNGNGVKDEIPMIGMANSGYADITSYILNAFVFAHDSYYFNVDENGQLWLPYSTDEYREAMIFLKKLVDEGLLSTLTWTQTSNENEALINAADNEYTVGIICGHADVSFEQGHDSIYTYEPLAPLADATGRGGYGPQQAWTLTYTTYITEDCENPVLAFKLLDFMCSQESYLRQRWGEYGVDWQYVDGGLGHLGGEAQIELLNPNMWNEQNASCWHNVGSVASEAFYEQLTDPDDADSWAATKNAKLVRNYQYSEAAGQPEELFTVVAYNEEEVEIRSDVRPDIITYLQTSRANFATGVMDPAKDSDWQTYLDGLDALHVEEWIACEQSAYDRSVGK